MSRPQEQRPQTLAGLRVDIASLRRRGEDRHQVQTEIPADWIGVVLAQTDAEVGDPGHLEVEILLPTDGAVIASGELTVKFNVPCGRCLDAASVDEIARLSATYVVGTQMPGPTGGRGSDDEEEGLGLTSDDLDTWLYDGSTLHLDALVAEHVKLAYPMRALCSRGEDCGGLCSNCGNNLNDKPAVGGRCPSCSRRVGPVVADAESAQSAGSPEGSPGEGPLAAALKKLQLPD